MSSDVEISDLILARYADDGRGPTAFDCYGLTAEIQARRGHAMPALATPQAIADRVQAIAAGAADCAPLPGPEPWCIVAIRVGPWVSHMGTVLADGQHFLHATRKLGIVKSRLDDPRWASRIAGYYRWVGTP